MAISVLTDGTTAIDTRNLQVTIPTVVINDVFGVLCMTWDQANTLGTPSGAGLGFSATPNAELSASSHSHIYGYVMKATAGGSNVVLTVPGPAAGCIHSMVVVRLPAADGYDLDPVPNKVIGTTTLTGSLTGTPGNIALVAAGDWQGTTGHVSTDWVPAGTTDDLAVIASGDNGQYYAHSTLTGSSTTVGTTVPTGSVNKGMIAIEVLAGAAAPPPVARPWATYNPGRTLRRKRAKRKRVWDTLPTTTSPTTPVSDTDTGVGADTAAVAAAETTSDTGVGADTAAVAATETASDTGAGADTASYVGQYPVSDTGAGADAATLAANESGADTGTGVDTASVAASGTAADTGTNTNSASVAAAETASDAGAGADSASLTTNITAGDTGTFTDTATASGGATPSGSDTGSGANSATVAAVVTASDTGTGADTATSVAATEAASDTGTGADTGTVAASDATADAGTNTNTATVTAALAAADLGSSLNAATIAAAIAAVDVGVFSDTAIVTVTITAGDVVVSVEVANAGTISADTKIASDLTIAVLRSMLHHPQLRGDLAVPKLTGVLDVV